MKKTVLLIILSVLALLGGCVNDEQGVISGDQLTQIEKDVRADTVEAFFNDVADMYDIKSDSAYVQKYMKNYNETRDKAKIQKLAGVLKTINDKYGTDKNFYIYDTLSYIESGEKNITVTVGVFKKSYYTTSSAICNSELVNNVPVWEPQLKKELITGENIYKIGGKIRYINWLSDKGGYSAGIEKTFSFEQVITPNYNTMVNVPVAIGKEQEFPTAFYIYADGKTIKSYEIGKIKKIYVNINDIYFLTSDNNSTFGEGNVAKKVITGDYSLVLERETNGTYKIDMNSSF